MGISRISSRALLTTAIWMALGAGAAHAQDALPPQEEPLPEGVVELERMIVTAQKRPEVLADIPQSITVLDEQTLERQQADNLQDYLPLVPGLSLTTAQRGVSRITLRGVNTGGVAATVGIYVDEVPFGSSSGLANGAIYAGDFDTFDLARIEVLRGPQGTLYGASALGGVLKFVTNAPSTDGFEARGKIGLEKVEHGDFGNSAVGVINVPLNDWIAIRASAYTRYEAGYLDSIGNNPIARIPLGNPDTSVNIVEGSRVADDVNDLTVSGGRVSALFEPSEVLSVRLTAVAQDIESEAANYFEADPDTLDPLYGDLVLSQYHPEFNTTKYRVYSGTVDWDLGFANLLSSTSYGTFHQVAQLDFAFLAPLVNLLAEFGVLTGAPITRNLSSILLQTVSTDKFAQELRLSSPENDTLEWLAGAYYTREKSGINPQQLLAVEAGTETIATDIPPLVDAFLDSTYQESAAFANATWHITPRFDLSFGGRASRNEQEAVQSLDGGLVGGLTAFDNVRSSESVFTYSVAPRFELSDNASIYARVATGYRPGGPNVLPPNAPPGTPTIYDSDSLTSYEVGLKADWFNRRFSLDVAAYYLDWEDIQLFAVINQTGVNTNGGTAVSQGVEFTAAARPMHGLTLSLNGAYTDAYLTEDTPEATGGFDGDPLPYVPEWSLNLNGDYEWTVMGYATAYVGASLSYVGDRTANFGQRVGPDSSILEVPSYKTANLRAGLDFGRWSLEAYVRNLTDERGATALFTGLPNGAYGLGVIRPRTIGLTLGAKF